MQIAWYSGGNLCQTVFTSLYYFNSHHMYPSTSSSNELVTLVLRAFVLAYRKMIELAYDELAKGHVIDGEDCWLDDYGLSSQVTESVDEVIDIVDQALDWLEQYDGESAYVFRSLTDRRLGARLGQSPGNSASECPDRTMLTIQGAHTVSELDIRAFERAGDRPRFSTQVAESLTST